MEGRHAITSIALRKVSHETLRVSVKGVSEKEEKNNESSHVELAAGCNTSSSRTKTQNKY